MSASLQKFQMLLRSLFQFDSADLDFGIYRILSHKRTAIEAFIDKDLPASISKALQADALGEQAHAVQELQDVASQVRENFGEDALDGDGVLAARHHDTRLGHKYLDVQARARGASSHAAVEATVYNHLYAFFSRYYDAGDFLSKRRYSKSEKYAVPYNGEEVHLHWANRDQYYVKTTEYFTDYRFASHGQTIRFELTAAHVDVDNVKGEKRFFIPQAKEAVFDAAKQELVIPFAYRALTGQELVKYGQKNQQDAINAEALTALPKRFKDDEELVAALLAERRRSADGEPITQLQHHLLQYTRRNAADYFVHKDLRSFLERELSFYLKNEVLLVDEVLDGDSARAEAWFQLSRAILAVGRRIIGFVAQIEDFQKTLFEKRKFVLDTQYCVAVGSIAPELYNEVSSNDAQWQEWKELCHIDEEQRDLFSAAATTKTARRVEFLQRHPSLVVDTKHFERAFVDRLLGSFEDLASITDGVLIHGENFQALALLAERLRGKVRCVYIDPPYNSKTTEILYKNTYKHSSWLSLMQDRLAISRGLTGLAGVHVVAIDENEAERLGLLLGNLFPSHEKTAVSIVHNPRGIQGDNFSYSHEYAYFIYPPEVGAISPKIVPQGEWEYQNLRNWGGESLRTDGKTCFYPIIVKGDRIVEIGEVPAEDFHPKGQNVRRRDGTVEVWPIDRKGVERKWRYARGSLRAVLHAARVKEDDAKIEIELARSVEMRKTVWEGAQYDASVYGTQLLSNLVSAAFSFPKSLHTVAECLQASGCVDGETVVDYFAGSGTTGHAAIHLNRQDGGRRRFVLVEMGQYFDTVLLPRIKKITYAPEWKDGKPRRLATAEEAARGPRLIKYLTLESYDDSLANVAFDEASAQPALRFDDYLLNYMLKWETKASNTFLNIESLADPFSYKLRLVRDGQSVERTVDLSETFDWVVGLETRSRTVWDDQGRRYLVERGTMDRREVVVIWRSTARWAKPDFERDRKFIVDKKLSEGADEVFVNGDSTLPGAKSLDPLFKARMFAPVSVSEAG